MISVSKRAEKPTRKNISLLLCLLPFSELLVSLPRPVKRVRHTAINVRIKTALNIKKILFVI